MAQFARAETADMTDHRDLSLKRASVCRKQAEAEPEKRERWADAAEEWDRRAKQGQGRSIATHEVHKGRMIPKPSR
jgi:hypothetical protein